MDDISPNHIICDKDQRAKRHPGNQLYQSLIREQRPAYHAAHSRKAKQRLTQSIFHAIYHTFGGRFVKKIKTDKEWHVLAAGDIHQKVSHALRSGKEQLCCQRQRHCRRYARQRQAVVRQEEEEEEEQAQSTLLPRL
mmetsp:Transcript_16971/g.37078  ORF Transcript_16971/g.37078 Transcript_16971/m.37078 type:complete len:137 (-) Transcript_16971:536-946(-)